MFSFHNLASSVPAKNYQNWSSIPLKITRMEMLCFISLACSEAMLPVKTLILTTLHFKINLCWKTDLCLYKSYLYFEPCHSQKVLFEIWPFTVLPLHPKYACYQSLWSKFSIFFCIFCLLNICGQESSWSAVPYLLNRINDSHFPTSRAVEKKNIYKALCIGEWDGK